MSALYLVGGNPSFKKHIFSGFIHSKQFGIRLLCLDLNHCVSVVPFRQQRQTADLAPAWKIWALL